MFACIYLLCNHERQEVDGLSVATEKIEHVRYLHDGKWLEGDVEDSAFITFCTQINNCGGHMIEIQDICDFEFVKSEYYIEVEFVEPVTINFYNNDEFVITDADRIPYNTSSNVLYWGEKEYEKGVDYTMLDSSLQEHKSTILENYSRLNQIIADMY